MLDINPNIQSQGVFSEESEVDVGDQGVVTPRVKLTKEQLVSLFNDFFFLMLLNRKLKLRKEKKP